ncbi:MAG: hypothetical protein HC838_09965 [Spirulinaceae cyanobacterium RM2_2_10]|nr:hypothetical protein [Spirulinaceae cyanobacterium SM2_1_0]NJO20293.1 hypothetical protein [Spirulinaceae cyanobacterium RM2_2_10]
MRNSRPYLIPRPLRRRFMALFTLCTVLGFLTGSWLAQAFSVPLLELLKHFASAQNSPLSGVFGIALVILVSNVIAGMCLGIGQWLILRPYVRNRWWIVATGIGWTINRLALEGIDEIRQLMWGNTAIGGTAFLLFSLSTAILVPLAFIGLGLAQWLILRKFVQRVWLWIFLPSLATWLAGLVLALPVVLLVQIAETLGVASAVGSQLAVVPALAFGFLASAFLCTRRRKRGYFQ